jgi:hypothetical protein
MRRRIPHLLQAAFFFAAWQVCAAVPRTTSEQGRPAIRAFEPAPVNAATQNWAAVEDAAGRVHFANSQGIVTFDGATSRLTRGERFSPVTRAVALAADGRIYAGSLGDLGWLRPLPGGRHEHVSLLGDLPEAARDFQEVFQIVAHGDAVYFTTGKHLLIFRGGRFTHVPHAVGRLDSAGGHLYLHSANAPLERIEGDRLVRVSEDPIILGDISRYFGPGPTPGTLLVASAKGGLSYLDLATGRATRWVTAIDELFKTKQIYRALRLADGSVAVAFAAASGGGLALIGADGAFLNYLDATTGLPNSVVYGLAPSRHGGLWLCLDYGTAYVDWPAATTLFQTANGLDRAIVSAISRHDSTLYVGNSTGLFRLLPGRAPQTTAKFERVFTGGVFSLISEGADLYGVADHKIIRLTPSGFVTVTPLPTLAYAMLRSKRDPSLRWIGHADGLRAFRETPTGWRNEGLVPGLSGMVRAISETPTGQIWVGIDSQGYFQITPGASAPATGAKVERFLAGPEEDMKRSRARLGTWRDETYFLLGNSHAILRFDEAKRAFAPFTGLVPLPATLELNAVALAPQNPRHLWVLTLDHDRETPPGPGVHRLSGEKLETLPYTISRALRENSALYEDVSTGVLWIGGSDGLARVDLARAFVPPPLGAVLTHGLDLVPGEVCAYERNAVDFDFVAPAAPTSIPPDYRTRLVGFQREWSPWSGEHRRSFTNLPEGAYTFEVQARDADARTGPIATLAFSILPPWWRTWWAYGGYGVFFGATILGFARLRTRALRKKNEQLEKIVATRTDDLRRQNGELARLHKLELDEKITARLAAEKAQLDVLRYQLNPHFLFNSLTSIRSQIPPALGSARDTLDRLADFCRLTLTGRKAEERTTVGEEIAMLRAYLDIEQTRMGELLSVEFAVDASLDGVLMPRLLLLPLVENALKYGQATSEEMLGLKISAQRGETLTRCATTENENALVFEISNTGTWVERGSRPGIPSTGIGHDNLRERLRRHYPEAHAFTHSVVDGWVRVRLELRAIPRST